MYKVPNDQNPDSHCRNSTVEYQKTVVLKELEAYIIPMKEVLTIIDEYYTTLDGSKMKN